jgi:hypothetical protein
MKKIVFIIMLALGFAWDCPAQTWTFVQDSVITFCPLSTSCNFHAGNVIPTMAGSLMIVRIHTQNNVTITNVTGGGGTWHLCPASSCHLFNSAISDNQDLAYNLSGTGGVASFTVTLSGAAAGFFGGNFIEFLPPSGSVPSFDVAGTTTSSTCTTCTGPNLSTTATDLILHVLSQNGASGPNAWRAFSSPYMTDYSSNAVNLNATSGTPPTITLSSAGADFSGIAFRTNLGSYTPPSQPMSVVNYTAVQTALNCNPSCSFRVPAIGTGHLLYLEAGSSKFISSASGGGTWTVPSGCQIAVPGSTGGSLSCAYVLSSTSGATTINVTMNGSGPTAFAMWEIASTGGPFNLDALGTAQRAGSPALDITGVPLSLSGPNDVIFQSAWISGGTNDISLYPGPMEPNGQSILFYSQSSPQSANAGSAALLNTTNGTAPIWINGGTNSAGTGVSGVAFKEGTGGATAPNPPTGLRAVVN